MQPGASYRRRLLLAASYPDFLRCSGMGREIFFDRDVPVSVSDVLVCLDLAYYLDSSEYGGRLVDERLRSVQCVGENAIDLYAGMVQPELSQKPQRDFGDGGTARISRRFGRTVFLRYALPAKLFVVLFPLFQFRIGLVKLETDGNRYVVGHQIEKHELLSVYIPAACLVLDFMQIVNEFGRFGSFLVGFVENKAAANYSESSYYYDSACSKQYLPWNRGPSEHPGQRRRRSGAEAGPFELGPAKRARNENSHYAKSQPCFLAVGKLRIFVVGFQRSVYFVDIVSDKWQCVVYEHVSPLKYG